ncbi:probable G-protein coupled receptor 148 [Brienomyrus brachyistius]|uniref:probable G-protein coupled receptor 148 n=1 Tax=Brienomyrus brachyistius TaxID=42636 RepID=UPI0020B23BF8|nr:probable G-protein coupled receptor 148 [Brienomyrus brachyistius]
MNARGSFWSLLCTFGSWYNWTNDGGKHGKRPDGYNLSLSDVELFTHEWQVFVPPQQMRALQMCPIICFLVVFPITPVILTKVLSSPRLRQETRYLLLANALLSDLAFVSVYAFTSVFNAAGVLMSEWGCATLLSLLGALYTAGILSTVTMALDTLLAVLSPLRYLALWPVSRTRSVVGAVWGLSVFFPLAMVGAFVWFQAASPCQSHICSMPLLLVLTIGRTPVLKLSMLLMVSGILLILLLIFCGYMALCCSTRRSGVRSGQCCSRAKGTFLMHYMHLFLSFCPMLVLIVELLLYTQLRAVDLRAKLWVSLVVCNVLLVLPKALAPYLYGLRYRDLRRNLLTFYRLRKTLVFPVM